MPTGSPSAAPALAVRPAPSDRTLAAPRSPSWQQAMKDAIRDPVELCRLLGLPAEFEEAARAAARSFPVFAPRSWVARIRFGNPHDPLLRQVLPLGEELNWPAEFTTDPVGDRLARRSPGLLSKYSGRVLLGDNRGLRDPLPLLFSPAFPLFRNAARQGGLAAGAGRNRGRYEPQRGDPLGRRPADAGRRAVGRIGRPGWPRSGICDGCAYIPGCRS